MLMNATVPEVPRAAALTALGYVLEELDAYEESPFEQATVDQVLTVICSSMAPAAPASVQQAAVVAMCNALPFVSANFSDAARTAERDSIMQAVCGATQSPHLPVREASFMCIEKIAELYYDHLAPYMEALAGLTFAAAKSARPEDEVRGRPRDRDHDRTRDRPCAHTRVRA